MISTRISPTVNTFLSMAQPCLRVSEELLGGGGPSEVSSHRDLADKVMKGRPGALAMQRVQDGEVGAREAVVLGQIPEQFPVPHEGQRVGALLPGGCREDLLLPVDN